MARSWRTSRVRRTIEAAARNLLLFVIEATQNRSDRAVQTKLDELIRAGTETRNRVIDLEDEDLLCCGREGIYSA